jgi:hypothetical protein
MTADHNFKRQVRARMAETGESYMQARRVLEVRRQQRGHGEPLSEERLEAERRHFEKIGRTP